MVKLILCKPVPNYIALKIHNRKFALMQIDIRTRRFEVWVLWKTQIRRLF